MSEPKSEFSTYYFECVGGKEDGNVQVLLDEWIESGIQDVIVNQTLYKITDQLLRPNVYKAILVNNK